MNILLVTNKFYHSLEYDVTIVNNWKYTKCLKSIFTGVSIYNPFVICYISVLSSVSPYSFFIIYPIQGTLNGTKMLQTSITHESNAGYPGYIELNL